MFTRVSPKPNIFLNLSDYKSVYFAKDYCKRNDGKMSVRFNDIHPNDWVGARTDAILGEFYLLGIETEYDTFASSYFELLLCNAEILIWKGMAYVDEADMSKISNCMRDKKETKSRTNTIKTNVELWKKMQQGENYVLRAKTCMLHPNECMRDPIIYIVSTIEHHKTGSTYKVYPTDIFAYPILDHTQDITHVFINNKYVESMTAYYWMLDALDLRKPAVIMYFNMEIDYSVTLHQKQLVDEKYVSGYDDPRLFTINSLIRRGMSYLSLQELMQEYFTKNRDVILTWDNLREMNSKTINRKMFGCCAIEKKCVKTITVGDAYFIDEILIEGEIIEMFGVGNVKVTVVRDQYVYGELTEEKGSREICWVNAKESVVVTVEKYDNILKSKTLEFSEGKIDPMCINKESKEEREYYGEIGLKNRRVGELVDLGKVGICRIDKMEGGMRLIKVE